MRYQEFRDRWHAALRSARVMSHQDHPEETIELHTGERRWSVLVLGRHAEPFQVSATISFLWDPFDSARSYTCEEDLLTELFGRRSGRSTQPRLVRVDIRLRATLPSPMGRPLRCPRPTSATPGSPRWRKSSTPP